MWWLWLVACKDDPVGDVGDDDDDTTAPTGDTAPTPTDPGPITTTPGGSEQCALLFGGNDRIRGDDDGFPVGRAARTMQAWIRTRSHQEQIAVSYGRASPRLGFLLGTVDGHPLLRSGNGLERLVVEDVDLADDAWHLLAASWDGNLALISVDGERVGSGVLEGDTMEGELVAGNTPTGDLGSPWIGWLDDLKVIYGVRSPEEVRDDPEALDIVPTDLLLWWDFEGIGADGSGVYVPDVSGNGRTGVSAGLNGTPWFPPCR